MISGPAKPGLYARINQSDTLARGVVGTWLFNEKAGPTVYDLSPNKNKGTFTNSPTWSPQGPFGSAISFTSASSQYIAINDYSDYDFPNKTFSVSFWFKTGTSSLQYIIGKMGPTNTGGWGVGIASGGTSGKLGVVTKNTGATSNCVIRESTSTVSDGRWYHCVALITSDTATSGNNDAIIYINGKQDQGSTTLSGVSDATAFGSQPLWIGGRGTGNYFNGSVDNVRIYNRRLRASEILRLYNDPFAGIAEIRPKLFNIINTTSGGRTASASITEADDTLSSSSTILISSSASIAEADDTISSSGSLLITASSSLSEADDTLSADGASGSFISGALSVTEDSDTLSSSSTILITASSSVTEADDTLSAASTSGGASTCLTTSDIPSIVSAIMTYEIEAGVTFEEFMRILLAVAAGKTDITGTTVTFRDIADTKARVTASMTGSERTTVTLDGT